ncbi:MAG: hypothetical protein ACYC35_01770 [Pirellulales bacterium]
MSKRRLKLNDLRRILRHFGVQEDPSRGKGSHTVFFKRFSDGVFTYPVPTADNDVKTCYVRGCRKRFRLTEEDGVSDNEFYGSL